MNWKKKNWYKKQPRIQCVFRICVYTIIIIITRRLLLFVYDFFFCSSSSPPLAQKRDIQRNKQEYIHIISLNAAPKRNTDNQSAHRWVENTIMNNMNGNQCEKWEQVKWIESNNFNDGFSTHTNGKTKNIKKI